LKQGGGIFLSTLPMASTVFADEPEESQHEPPATSFYELRDRAVVRVGDEIFLTHVGGDVFQGKIESVSWGDATVTLENALIDSEGKLGARTLSEPEIRRIEGEKAIPSATVPRSVWASTPSSKSDC
jgi:hypothetical protein